MSEPAKPASGSGTPARAASVIIPPNKVTSVVAPKASMATASTEEASKDLASFDQMFTSFSQFGDSKSNGTTICLTQSDKWMKQAKILDGRNITTTDTGVLFSKFKRRAIKPDQYLTFLEDLAREKSLDLQTDLLDKMLSCGLPGSKGTPNLYSHLVNMDNYRARLLTLSRHLNKARGDAPHSSTAEIWGHPSA